MTTHHGSRREPPNEVYRPSAKRDDAGAEASSGAENARVTMIEWLDQIRDASAAEPSAFSESGPGEPSGEPVETAGDELAELLESVLAQRRALVRWTPPENAR